MNRSLKSISSASALGLALVALAPSVAHAQTAPAAPPAPSSPAPTSEEAARVAFAEGLRLRDTARRPTEALSKFAEAYALAATAITAYELGATHLAVGNLIEAQQLFIAIGQMPADPLQSARGKIARENAKRQAAELEAHIPSIMVKLEGMLPEEATPRVAIDGKPVPVLTTAHRVNPGERKVVVVSADGTERSKVVTVLDGKVQVVTFDVSPGIKISLADRKQVGVIVGGAGVVAVGISLVLGASAALSNSSALERHCGARVMGQSENHCDYQGIKDIKSAGRTADAATVLFIIGGAAVATGAILWITAPPSKKRASVGLGASLGGVHLQGGF